VRRDGPGALVLAGSLLLAASCTSRAQTAIEGPREAGNKRATAAGDDGARCEYKGRLDREVAESVGTGAIQPSIRRVYRVLGEGEQRRRILVCREVDTNLDGIKDLVRRYSDQGEATEEEADTDYDGTFDTFIRFGKGRIARVEVDLDNDGKRDETRFYLKGKLSRIQRDTNRDGNPDIWEIYSAGRLERMGQDLDFDGRVDRWNRDEVRARDKARAELEAERKEAEAPPDDSEPAPGVSDTPTD
jgi:hypothetical protein